MEHLRFKVVEVEKLRRELTECAQKAGGETRAHRELVEVLRVRAESAETRATAAEDESARLRGELMAAQESMQRALRGTAQCEDGAEGAPQRRSGEAAVLRAGQHRGSGGSEPPRADPHKRVDSRTQHRNYIAEAECISPGHPPWPRERSPQRQLLQPGVRPPVSRVPPSPQPPLTVSRVSPA